MTPEELQKWEDVVSHLHRNPFVIGGPVTEWMKDLTRTWDTATVIRLQEPYFRMLLAELCIDPSVYQFNFKRHTVIRHA
jgi:hypothetical protein